MENEIIICPYCKGSIELLLDDIKPKEQKAIYILGEIIGNKQ